MELLIQRSQKGGLMGGVKFILSATVRLDDAERGYVSKYKMNDIVLYEKGGDKLAAATGAMSMIAARLMQLRVSVADLIAGKTIEGKDIADMMAAQEQIKEAVGNFQKVLQAAASFEGEEVIAYK